MTSPLTFALAAGTGAFTWTFLEYVIHRWAGHHGRLRGNPFGLEHVRHHAEGNYFAANIKKVATAAAVAVVLGLPAALLAGVPGLVWLAGLLVAYGGYEVFHRREHTHGAVTRYGRWARAHHFHHHFVDPRTNHGVTSPLWDHVFRTHRPVTIIPVPRRLAPLWLLDATGAVRPAHAPRYTVRDPRR